MNRRFRRNKLIGANLSLIGCSVRRRRLVVSTKIKLDARILSSYFLTHIQPPLFREKFFFFRGLFSQQKYEHPSA